MYDPGYPGDILILASKASTVVTFQLGRRSRNGHLTELDWSGRFADLSYSKDYS